MLKRSPKKRKSGGDTENDDKKQKLDVESMTVAMLKKEIESLGGKPKGKKADLQVMLQGLMSSGDSDKNVTSDDFEEMKRIVCKWNENSWPTPGLMVRFKDGNACNCIVANLEYVTYNQCFEKKPTEQKVDWDMDLTKKEQRFVLDHWDGFRVLFEKVPLQKIVCWR